MLISLPAPAAETDKIYSIVNNNYRGRITLSFVNASFACLTPPLLREWGFIPAIQNTAVFDAQKCLAESEITRWKIRYFFDKQAQLMTFVVPENLMTNTQNGIATSRWDDGIPALFTNYHLNFQRNSGHKYRYQPYKNNLWLSFNSGINLGSWRLRVGHQYQESSYAERGWLTRHLSLTRALRPLRAQLTLGDSRSSSNLFDSVNYRGAGIATDERMLPDGLRPFSPLIRGVARRNAEVTLRQNGLVIYQTFVAPGPFTLRNVYPPNPEGDIEMTITENDGTETLHTMPYAAMPNLAHQNVMNYQLLAGRYKPWFGSDLDEPAFIQGTLTYGLTSQFSLFTGAIASRMFKSWGSGVGLRMGKGGAISLDQRFSVAEEPRRPDDNQGRLWRIRYAKSFLTTGSSLSLQWLYYPPGQRYRHFDEAIEQQKTYWWEWDDEGRYDGEIDPERLNSINLYFNQNLGENSNLYMTFQRDNLRKKDHHTTSLTLGFEHTWNDIDYSLALSHERRAGLPAEGSLLLNISIPFDSFSHGRSKLNLQPSLTNYGQGSQQISVSGTALQDYSLRYSLGAEHSQTLNDSVNASLGYQHNAGEWHVDVAKGEKFRQRNVDISGSIMIHPYGITLGQTLGNTMALVEVKNSPGIGIDNQFGVTTDKRGFALVSYLTPYRVNRLTLDGFSLADNRHLPETELEVVPTAGAIVPGRFSESETY